MWAEPTFAYNCWISRSIIMLDMSAAAAQDPSRVLPGCSPARVTADVHDGALLAREAGEALDRVKDNFGPEDCTVAFIVADEGDTRAEPFARALADRGALRSAVLVPRTGLEVRFPFLFSPGVSFGDLPFLPNEVVPGKLFLGSRVTAGERALALLGITHVVSATERAPPVPPAVRQLHIDIVDDEGTPLGPALDLALPFLRGALAEPQGRALVHCDRGASRSASIVAALLMAEPALRPAGAHGARSVLAHLQAARPDVRPNEGFIRQLEQLEGVLMA